LIQICANAQICINYTDLAAAQPQYGTWTGPNLITTNGLIDYGYANWLSRHTVHTVLEYDTITLGGLRTIPAGASASVRLGNKGIMAEWEGLTYTFTVDSLSLFLLFKYAIVMEEPGHGIDYDPKLTFEILNANNQIIYANSIPSFQLVSGPVPVDPTWHHIPANTIIVPSSNMGIGTRPANAIYWKEWTNFAVNLTSPLDLRGQIIKVRIRNYDCAYTGHFGYSYFTLDCATTTFYNADFCHGTYYSDENFTVPIYQAGTYYTILQDINNQDSVVCLVLTQREKNITNYSAIICTENSYSDDNFSNLTQAGYYYDTLQNIYGCDSIVILNLVVTEECIEWTFENGTLTINGTGAMPNYSITNPQHINNKNLRVSSEIAETSAPWNIHSEEILHIIIGEGITKVGAYAFYNCVNALSVELASTVGEIGEYAFAQCGSLKEIIIHNENGIIVDETAFENVNTSEVKLIVPEGSEDIYNNDDIWGSFIIGKENSIVSPSFNDRITIYPNPMKEELIITSENRIEKIEICDIAGHTVETRLIASLQGNATINVSSLPQGVYLVKIYTDKGVVTKKVVKN